MSAACGRRSESSEWQRSADAEVLRHRRQMLGTATGVTDCHTSLRTGSQ